MAEIGDKVRIKITSPAKRAPFYVEGIVNGKYKNKDTFWMWEYLVTEWKGVEPLKVRKLKVIHDENGNE